MSYGSGIQKRIRRWAKVDPLWANFIETRTRCEADGCGIETTRNDGITARPNDRIYICLNSNEQLSPQTVRCLCRKHAGQ